VIRELPLMPLRNRGYLREKEDPSKRVSGGGGANDIASMADRILIIMKHERRRFPERVSHNTAPGHVDGPGGRGKAVEIADIEFDESNDKHIVNVVVFDQELSSKET